MNEKSSFSQRGQTREQTAYQLNSRQSRNYLSAKIVGLIRANDKRGEFNGQELIHLESILRDEMQTNPWLLNLFKAISDESVVVTKDELNLFNKYQTEGQDVCITQSQVEELHKELEFLRERVHVLRYIIKDLTEKLTEVTKNHSNDRNNDLSNNSTDVWLKMRFKLIEFLEIIKKDLNSDLRVEEPKHIADLFITEFNDRTDRIKVLQNPNDWLNRQLDNLALSELNKREVFESLNSQMCLKLGEIHKNLITFYKECERIKEFYEINVKEEMSWRTDLNTILTHFKSFNDSKLIEVNSIQSETNGLEHKKQLIRQYSQLFENIENQEVDELRALIEGLKDRIEILTDKTK